MGGGMGRHDEGGHWVALMGMDGWDKWIVLVCQHGFCVPTLASEILGSSIPDSVYAS